MDKGETVGSVIFDLSKAFDLIPHNLLLDKLKAYGLSTQSLNLIKDYLSGWRQRVMWPMPSLTLSRSTEGYHRGLFEARCSLISF